MASQSDDVTSDQQNKFADTLEQNSLSKRVMRYARVSGSVGGLVARVAGEKYLGVNYSREEHAKKLMKTIGNLKGPMLKVAQLLATIPEALPREYVAELQQLQSNAPSMGWPFVKRRMKAELGADWQSQFKIFEKKAAAAASLGQVHKAQTILGQDIACKLQYPDMGGAIEADLSQLKVMFSMFENYDKAISTDKIYEELSEYLYEELDYKREAKYYKLYRHLLRNEDSIHVPKVIDDLSTDRLLSTSWVDGKKILDFKEAAPETRNKIALNMFRAWYVPLYFHGIIHGDPHPGNYTIRPNCDVNLMDFGCVRVFPPKFVKGVIDLYYALLRNDDALAIEAYESWGFKNINKDFLKALNLWARFLYGPILENKTRKIGDVVEGGGVYGRETAKKVHEELRKIGGVQIPREFVFMDRAALGLGSVFLHLNAEVNWYQVFNELIDGFDMDELATRQKKTLKKFELI